ncbi:MAG: Hsp20/alpha crystallin family protein [bacterium]|nr:Hsp20/alpha crystallin family protein [bacterium]
MLRPSILEDGFLDNIFDDFFHDTFGQSTGIRSVSAMNTDIVELEHAYQIEMELPGFSKEDVRAELKDGYLIIRASRKESKSEKENKRYIRKERYSGHYQRSFYLGRAIKEDDIKAVFKNGILMLEVAKKEKMPKVQESKYIAIED